VFDDIEVFCNRQRLHSSVSYHRLVAFEVQSDAKAA
jgi:hypothetical protein